MCLHVVLVWGLMCLGSWEQHVLKCSVCLGSKNTQNPQYWRVNDLEREEAQTSNLYNFSFIVSGSIVCKFGVCSHVLNLLYVCVYTNEEQYTVCMLIWSSLFIWVSSVLISCWSVCVHPCLLFKCVYNVCFHCCNALELEQTHNVFGEQKTAARYYFFCVVCLLCW